MLRLPASVLCVPGTVSIVVVNTRPMLRFLVLCGFSRSQKPWININMKLDLRPKDSEDRHSGVDGQRRRRLYGVGIADVMLIFACWQRH